jgi:hypothetical protein
MTFALAGSVITQSGTDTSFAGLTGLSGVTTQAITGTVYPLTIYTLTNRFLKITGTVTLGSREKLIFTGMTAQNNILEVDGGTLNIGEAYTRNSYTTQLPIEAIVWALTSGGSWDTRVWVVRNAGKCIARNALFRIPHSIWWEQNASGQLLLEDCVIDKRGSTGDIQTNHANNVANSTVLRRVKLLADGQAGITFRNTNMPTIENVEVYQSRDSFVNVVSALLTVRGIVPNLGNLADVAQWEAYTTAAVNAASGVQMLWGGHLPTSAVNTGALGVWQEIAPTVRTPAAVAIEGAIFYLTDTAVAADSAQTALQSPLGGTVNTTLRRTYIASSNSSGVVATQTVLIGTGLRTVGGAQFVGGNSNRIRPRGKNTTAILDATDDIYDYAIWSYAHIGQVNPVTLKGGIGNATVPLSIPAVAVTDPNVTLSKVAAAALTSIANTDNLYDVAKNWKCTATQANLEYPTISTQPVTATGTTLTLGSLNLVIDNGAAAAFAINTSTNVITVKSASFAAGAKSNTVTTTGAITVSSGVSVSAGLIGTITNAGTISGAVTGNVANSGTLASGANITGNVTQATPTSISGVNITGNLTYNTNTPVTVTFTNSTVTGTVSNSGTGAVTIRLANSTVGTAGTNVTTQIVTSLNLTGLTAGSQIYVSDNTGTEIAYVSSSGTSYNLDTTGGTGTWEWRLRKYGYQDQTGTFTPATSSESVVAAYLTDAFVVDTLVNVTAYTNLQTAQKIYDYSRYFATTNTGIALAAQFDKGFGTITANSAFTLNPSAVALMAVASGVVTTKTSGLAESVTVVVTGNFTQGTATLSNDVKIRATNLDSELLFSGIDSLTVYATQSDALNNTSSGATSTTGIIRFLYGAALSGVTMSGTVYLRLTLGTAIQVQSLVLVLGENEVNLSTTTLLQSINTKVDNVPTEVLAATVETNTSLAESLRLANSVLGGKVSGASTSTETFRDINNTKNRVVADVDSNGNRTAITLDLS